MSPPVTSCSTTPPRAIGEPRPDPEVLNLVDGLRAGGIRATGLTGQQQRGAAGARGLQALSLHGASRRVGSWDPGWVKRGGAMNRKPVAFGTLQVPQ